MKLRAEMKKCGQYFDKRKFLQDKHLSFSNTVFGKKKLLMSFVNT